MPCYVDRLQQWPSAVRTFQRSASCHLIADTLEELHEMATKIGMKREWFQACPPASTPHYDLVPSRRLRAIQLGAIELDRSGFVEKVRELRAKRMEVS